MWSGTLAAAIEEGYDALAQTTDMNPVLKKAGVVDAGGKGYLLILDGMLAELRGEPIPESMEEPSAQGKGRLQCHGAGGDHLHLRHRYCGAQGQGDIDLMPCGLTSAASATVWSSVRTMRTFKVHVHTDIPGAALTNPRNTAHWSWRRLRICVLRPTRWPRPDRPEH